MTHISALSGGSRANSYQRLEFLGDHVLGLVDLRHALSRLSEGERGRTVAPAGRSRAQGNLCRRCACDGSRARRSSSAIRNRTPAGRLRSTILGRRLRGAGRRRLSRRRLSVRSGSDRAASGRSACSSRCGRCATPRPCCRNGRRRAACRRRPIARSRAPARITARNSVSPSNCPTARRQKGIGRSKRAAEQAAAAADAGRGRHCAGQDRCLRHRRRRIRAAASSR